MGLNGNGLPQQVGTDYLSASAETIQRTAQECVEAIYDAAESIAGAFASGNKVLLCGNGGSAADCQHLATEFVNQMRREQLRPGLPAIALTTDTSFLTAHANDDGFESVFERQVQVLGKPGDILIAISTSGRSPNVVRAVTAAREIKMHTVALTGAVGPLTEAADFAIRVPSSDTQHIQEAHLAVEHLLCHLVEERLFPVEETGQDGAGKASVPPLGLRADQPR